MLAMLVKWRNALLTRRFENLRKGYLDSLRAYCRNLACLNFDRMIKRML